MADTLADAVGIDQSDMPICLETLSTDGTSGLDPEEDRRAITCLLSFCKRCSCDREEAIKIVTEHISLLPGLCALEPAIIEAEADRVYASGSNKSLCDIVRKCNIGKHCEPDFCEWPNSDWAMHDTDIIISEDSKKDEVSPEIRAKALEILKHRSPISAATKYIQKSIRSDGSAEKVLLYSGFSAFMSRSDLLHSDINGSSQAGKSSRVASVLSTFPEDSVIMLTEASPKSLYYMARSADLNKKIVYLDDARDEHIPLLKTFRNDGPIIPRNATVADGEYVDIPISGRPVLIASSVVPLRDHEQQATSRTFLITIPDPDEDEEREIRKKIRQRLEAGPLLSESEDKERDVLREMSRILRDEGTSSIVVPFDAREPESADRRGTGQFVRLIKISAFINQYQRPILEMKDGSKHILAIYDDLKNALEIWFSFDVEQRFKVTHRAGLLLRALPTQEPVEKIEFDGGSFSIDDTRATVSRIATDSDVKAAIRSQKTVSRYLEDLYDNGLVYRKQISLPGSPFAYWTDEEIRQKAMSKIPLAGGKQIELGQIETKSACPKYMAKYSSDSLENSIKEFFNNLDKKSKENMKAITNAEGTVLGNGNEILSTYLTLFQNHVLNITKESEDSDSLGQGSCPKSGEMPTDTDVQSWKDVSQTDEECPKYADAASCPWGG